MGTRHLICVVSDNQYRIAQYGQWDGYPEGQDFSQDSLFCEWAYVIDFDKNTFEVYRGFNETPLDESERFYTAGQKEDDNGLYPVRMIKAFDLSALPSEDEFLEICEPTEDEPEEEMEVDFGSLTGI